MKRAFGFLLLACSVVLAQSAPSRPPITGISHIAVYAADPAAAEHYYVDLIGCEKRPDPENPKGTRYYVNSMQFVEVLPLADKSSPNRLAHLAYNTTDVVQMERYLRSKGIEAVRGPNELADDGSRWFDVEDPEGNTVQFVQLPAHRQPVNAPNLLGHHIIHVGMLVHSREKEDTFYRAILDFRPYWFGGMQPDKIDWVSQQTPESHDWLEYMLVGSPTTTHPGGATSQHELGVLNHLSIGVISVPETFDRLKAANRLSSPDDHTQIGKDGKWQLNLFDPDGTRLEFMEFSNVRPPCCSEFTAPNPSPPE